MFAFPELMLSPVMSGLGIGVPVWPAVGAVFAWTMIAALMASVVGILTESTRRPTSGWLVSHTYGYLHHKAA